MSLEHINNENKPGNEWKMEFDVIPILQIRFTVKISYFEPISIRIYQQIPLI